MDTLHGKTVLVTGASRGIGAAIARRCAQEGARVLLHYSASAEAVWKLRAEIGGKESDLLQADLSREGAGGALWQAARAAAGRIDGVVANAGIFDPTPIGGDAEMWARGWTRTLAVNLQAPADLFRAALNDMRREGEGGVLIGVASRAAQRGDDPDHAAYAASKAGLVAMIKTYAKAYAREGVLAYAIAPGWVGTDMAPQDEEAAARAAAEIPLGRFAAPEELGALAGFLLSGACPSATGATFDVNGASYLR